MAIAPATRARFQATVACAGTLLLWWRHGGPLTATLTLLAAALASLAWLSPPRYTPVQRILDRLTHALLAAFSWLVLAVVYFGLFAPVRLGLALTGRDPLRRPPQTRTSARPATYLQPLPPPAARHFERQF